MDTLARWSVRNFCFVRNTKFRFVLPMVGSSTVGLGMYAGFYVSTTLEFTKTILSFITYYYSVKVE